MCDRWLNSFPAFLADMGKRPSSDHSLDRIDVNGDYEPGNCRWATAKEQSHNRRLSADRVREVLLRFESEALDIVKAIRKELGV